jgi:ribA/ribD-fused uncharacterized protein
MIARQHADRRRADWDEVKLGVMLDILRHKLAQNPYVEQKLRDTQDREIVEDSPTDAFWGWGPDGHGRNELGKLWMRLRRELQSAA